MGRDREYPGWRRQKVEEKDRRDDKKWAGRAWEVQEFYCAAAGWGVRVGISTRISGCDASEQHTGRWTAASMYRYGRWHEPRTKPAFDCPENWGMGNGVIPAPHVIMYGHSSIRHEVGRGRGQGTGAGTSKRPAINLITCTFKQKPKQKTPRTRSQLGPIDTGAKSRKPRKSPDDEEYVQKFQRPAAITPSIFVAASEFSKHCGCSSFAPNLQCTYPMRST